MAATAERELLTRVAATDGIHRPDQCDWADPPCTMAPADPSQGAGRRRLATADRWRYHAVSRRGSRRHQPPAGPCAGRDRGAELWPCASRSTALTGLSCRSCRICPNRHCGSDAETILSASSCASRANSDRDLCPAQRATWPQPGTDRASVQLRRRSRRRRVPTLPTRTSTRRRLEKAWLDLILEGPEMNRIAIWDMTLVRAPRADI